MGIQSKRLSINIGDISELSDEEIVAKLREAGVPEEAIDKVATTARSRIDKIMDSINDDDAAPAAGKVEPLTILVTHSGPAWVGVLQGATDSGLALAKARIIISQSPMQVSDLMRLAAGKFTGLYVLSDEAEAAVVADVTASILCSDAASALIRAQCNKTAN